MSDVIKYNPNDPLFDKEHLLVLYKDNYKEFHNMANYFKSADKLIYERNFLPIIVEKTSFIRLYDKIDTFDNFYAAFLDDNKIEFSNDWQIGLQVYIFRNEKRIKHSINLRYIGSEPGLKINKKRTLGVKINNNTTYLDSILTSRNSIGGGSYLVTALVDVEYNFLKDLIFTNDIELRICTEFKNYDFVLTYATKYGFEKYFEKYLKPLEDNYW